MKMNSKAIPTMDSVHASIVHNKNSLQDYRLKNQINGYDKQMTKYLRDLKSSQKDLIADLNRMNIKSNEGDKQRQPVDSDEKLGSSTPSAVSAADQKNQQNQPAQHQRLLNKTSSPDQCRKNPLLLVKQASEGSLFAKHSLFMDDGSPRLSRRTPITSHRYLKFGSDRRIRSSSLDTATEGYGEKLSRLPQLTRVSSTFHQQNSLRSSSSSSSSTSSLHSIHEHRTRSHSDQNTPLENLSNRVRSMSSSSSSTTSGHLTQERRSYSLNDQQTLKEVNIKPLNASKDDNNLYHKDQDSSSSHGKTILAIVDKTFNSIKQSSPVLNKRRDDKLLKVVHHWRRRSLRNNDHKVSSLSSQDSNHDCSKDTSEKVVNEQLPRYLRCNLPNEEIDIFDSI